MNEGDIDRLASALPLAQSAPMEADCGLEEDEDDSPSPDV